MEKTLFRPEYRVLLGLIRQARNDAGVTQEELASRLAVPRSTVTKWETGQQRMDLLEFWSFCEGIEADPLEVLTRFKEARKAPR
ncbi:MAG: helix-turn-helix transcriptional regulator [Holophaga sp.]|nr:helix-turn-helix transcriptional regulator [Holophaga sp.]